MLPGQSVLGKRRADGAPAASDAGDAHTLKKHAAGDFSATSSSSATTTTAAKEEATTTASTSSSSSSSAATAAAITAGATPAVPPSSSAARTGSSNSGTNSAAATSSSSSSDFSLQTNTTTTALSPAAVTLSTDQREKLDSATLSLEVAIGQYDNLLLIQKMKLFTKVVKDMGGAQNVVLEAIANIRRSTKSAPPREYTMAADARIIEEAAAVADKFMERRKDADIGASFLEQHLAETRLRLDEYQEGKAAKGQADLQHMSELLEYYYDGLKTLIGYRSMSFPHSQPSSESKASRPKFLLHSQMPTAASGSSSSSSAAKAETAAQHQPPVASTTAAAAAAPSLAATLVAASSPLFSAQQPPKAGAATGNTAPAPTDAAAPAAPTPPPAASPAPGS